MESELATAALQEMPLQRAAEVLERIEADEAADLLSELPDSLAQELLALLPDKREQDLRRLASHPEHTAGSLMTTDYVKLPRKATAGKALEWIRRERPEQHMMTYLYVVDPEERLVGVVSLRDLVLAQPEDEVVSFMEDDVVQVMADVDEEEVGRVMTKYDLLALPVVDGEHHLIGIVTLDDALEAVVPDDWKQRLPRLYR